MERIAVEPPEGVERGLVGGYVGYLGYELKADCGSPNVHSSDMPDAAMMLANRVVAVDHTKGLTYVFALCNGEDPEAELWLDAAEELIAAAIASPPAERPLAPPSEPGGHVVFHSGRGRERYLADIAKSQAELAGRRVLRGLPHRPVLDRRQPGAVRPLPAAAAQQRLAVLGLPPARR